MYVSIVILKKSKWKPIYQLKSQFKDEVEYNSGGGDQTSLFSDWLNRSVMFLNKRAPDDFDGVDNNDAFLNVAN